MKKILFLLSSKLLSGGEKVALDIAKGLKDNFEFIFLIPKEPEKVLKESLEGFKIYFPLKRGFLNLIREIKRIIDLEKPDIIHAHGIRAATFLKISLLFFIKKDFKFFYTLQGIHFLHYGFPIKFLFTVWEILTNSFFVDFLICVGDNDLNSARKLKLTSNKRLVLIENGICLDEYENYESGKIRGELKIKNRFILTTICRLHPQKDVYSLIKAIDLLRDEDLILLIAGDGPEKARLENLVKSLHLEDKIKFLGYRKDIKEILSDSDIFILSTKWEGLPIVILEAWAMKKPVIASAVDGIKGMIRDGENGILFKMGDEKDLSNRIRLLLSDEELWNRISQNGFNEVKSRYNMERMIRNYEKLYSASN